MSVAARAQHTAHVVRVHRSAGATRRRSRVPRQQRPLAIERDYAAELRRVVVDAARRAWEPELGQLRSVLAFAALHRGDAPGDESRQARALAEQARVRSLASVREQELEILADKYGRRTVAYQRLQLNRQIRAALGVDWTFTDARVRDMLAQFVHENVALISSIPARLADDIEAMILRAITSGQSYEDLRAAIDARFGVGERRADLIARDQINKLFEAINQARQSEIGITKFRWRDVGDNRVRRTHQLHATRNVGFGPGVYLYADPPWESGERVLPGEPVACRCGAEPVFDDLLALLR